MVLWLAHLATILEDPGLIPHSNFSSHLQDFINSFEKKAAFNYSPNYQTFEVGYQEHGNKSVKVAKDWCIIFFILCIRGLREEIMDSP